MYLRIYRDVANTSRFWQEWGVSYGVTDETTRNVIFEYPLFEGAGFMNSLTPEECHRFDRRDSGYYDPARCGAFADWLQENAERLTAHFSEEDKPLALERLQNLCDWLRSGLQISA